MTSGGVGPPRAGRNSVAPELPQAFRARARRCILSSAERLSPGRRGAAEWFEKLAHQCRIWASESRGSLSAGDSILIERDHLIGQRVELQILNRGIGHECDVTRMVRLAQPARSGVVCRVSPAVVLQHEDFFSSALSIGQILSIRRRVTPPAGRLSRAPIRADQFPDRHAGRAQPSMSSRRSLAGWHPPSRRRERESGILQTRAFRSIQRPDRSLEHLAHAASLRYGRPERARGCAPDRPALAGWSR